MDLNKNGIPDSQEFLFTIAKATVLVWSMGMLSASYFGAVEVDRTFLATTLTASAASFGIKKQGSEPKPPVGRTEAPRDLRHK